MTASFCRGFLVSFSGAYALPESIKVMYVVLFWLLLIFLPARQPGRSPSVRPWLICFTVWAFLLLYAPAASRSDFTFSRFLNNTHYYYPACPWAASGFVLLIASRRPLWVLLKNRLLASVLFLFAAAILFANIQEIRFQEKTYHRISRAFKKIERNRLTQIRQALKINQGVIQIWNTDGMGKGRLRGQYHWRGFTPENLVLLHLDKAERDRIRFIERGQDLNIDPEIPLYRFDDGLLRRVSPNPSRSAPTYAGPGPETIPDW